VAYLNYKGTGGFEPSLQPL